MKTKAWWKTSAFLLLSMGIGLVSLPLSAQEAGASSREKKLDEIVDFFDKFDLIGLIRVRPELKDNYDFDKYGTSCTGTVCTDSEDKAEFAGQKVQAGFLYKGDTVKAKLLFQDARVWGGESGSNTGLSTAKGPGVTEATDVREAWFDVKLADALSLQLGRQKLVYGDQRLLGGLDWTDIGRSFDGARLKLNTDSFSIHAFAMVLTEEDSSSVGNTTANAIDSELVGWYNTIKFNKNLHVDLYYIGKYTKYSQKTTPDYAATGITPVQIITTDNRQTDKARLHTYGIRLTNKTVKGKGKPKAPSAIDWTVEYAVQQGTTGSYVAASWDTAQVIVPVDTTSGVFTATNNPCRVAKTATVGGTTTLQGCRLYTEKQRYDAFGGAANAGYSFGNFRIGGEIAVGSGDPNRSDAASATFQNLYPTNHLFYGQADQVSLQNMVGKSVNFLVKMGQYGKLKLAYWEVKKHKLQDKWYNVGGGASSVATTESSNNSRFATEYNSNGTLKSLGVGYLKENLFKEYDLTYSFKVGEVGFSVGYSLIVAGDAVRGPKDDYAVLWQTYGQEILNGTISTANLLKFQRSSFDREAQFAYFSALYKF